MSGTICTFTNATNRVDSVGHGLANDTQIFFTNEAGGLPAELVEFKQYFIVNKTTDDFQVSLTQGGAAVTISDDGTGENQYHVPYISSNTGASIDSVVDSFSGENLLINGGMEVAERGTSFTSGDNNDDTYNLDKWILLSDGNDVVDITQESGGGVNGNSYYMRLDVETVQKKFGIFQIIDNSNCRDIIGSTCSVGIDLRVTNATKLSDIRVVVVSWDSTADTVTSDIISAWGAEGVNPTLISNWTEENTSANLSVTTSWVRYEIENISIDTASAANVGVFIYQNNVATNDTAGVFLEITNAKLEPGTSATQYRNRLNEDYLCKQRYERIGGANDDLYHRASGAGGVIGTTFSFIPKKKIPTATKVGTWTVANCNQPAVVGVGKSSVSLAATGASGDARFETDNANTYIELDSDL